MPSSPIKYFQAGGSLSANLPSYIERKADRELYQQLVERQFCYVLTSRQMGKSSLKVRTMKKLNDRGWLTVSIDLTAFGTTGFTSEQWYLSFLSEIADAFDIEDEFYDWWEEKKDLTPVAKMTKFWGEFLLKMVPQDLVIMIDEVDTMLSLDRSSFSTDDFFAAIRAAYNQRSKNKDYERLNFAIFGVATPQDLMTDHERTPFNIGVPIELNQFTSEEVKVLASGLPFPEQQNIAILERILFWTNGQPFLTQNLSQLCSRLEESEVSLLEQVDNLVANEFFHPEIFRTPHFSNIQTRILKNEEYNSRMLYLYQKIYKENEVAFDVQSLEILYLKLSGIIIEGNSGLRIGSKIYTEVFDEIWVEEGFGQIDRPFAVDMQRWLKADKASEFLIKGKVLEEIEIWADSRDDLSSDEREFLQQSKLADIDDRKAQEIQALKEAERIRLQRTLRFAIAAAILAVVFAAVSFYQADKAQRTNENLIEAQDELTAKADSLQQEIIARRAAQIERDSINANSKIATATVALEQGKKEVAISVLEREINQGNSDPRLKTLLDEIFSN